MLRPITRADRRAQAELLIEPAGLLELLDPVDPQISAAGELLEGEPVSGIGVVELLDAATHGPLGLGSRQHARDLRAVDLIGTLVGPASLRKRCARPGHDLLHDLGQVPDAVVLAAGADVEGLVVDSSRGASSTARKAAGNVLYVHQRAPGGAVALDQDLTGRVGVSDQVVDYDVDAEPRLIRRKRSRCADRSG